MPDSRLADEPSRIGVENQAVWVQVPAPALPEGGLRQVTSPGLSVLICTMGPLRGLKESALGKPPEQ